MSEHNEFMTLIFSMGGWLATMIFGVITLIAATMDYFVTEHQRYKYAAALRRISWIFSAAVVCGFLILWLGVRHSRLASAQGGLADLGAYEYVPVVVSVMLWSLCRWVGKAMSVTVEAK